MHDNQQSEEVEIRTGLQAGEDGSGMFGGGGVTAPGGGGLGSGGATSPGGGVLGSGN